MSRQRRASVPKPSLQLASEREMRDKRYGKYGVKLISGWLAMLPRLVVYLAKATHLIPIFRALLRQSAWPLPLGGLYSLRAIPLLPF